MKLQNDKKDHIAAGAFAALIGLAFGFNVGLSQVFCGLLFPILAGAGKEWIWDGWLSIKYEGKKFPFTNKIIQKGTVDVWDFVATTSGGLIIVILAIILKLIFPNI